MGGLGTVSRSQAPDLEGTTVYSYLDVCYEPAEDLNIAMDRDVQPLPKTIQVLRIAAVGT